MAWSKVSIGLSGFLVPLLAVAARLVLVFPACLCLYDYFCVVRFCFGSINAMNASDFALCPLAALIFSFQSMVGPYRGDNGELLPHYLPILLIALAFAVAWAVVDHRRYGKGWS
jgi:hypothetical protein